MVPVATSNASTRAVLPAPDCPTSTTFCTLSGWSAEGALPAAPDVAFSAIPPPPCVHVGCCCCQPLPLGVATTSPRRESALQSWPAAALCWQKPAARSADGILRAQLCPTG